MPAPPIPAAEAARLRARRDRLRRRLMIGIWGVPLLLLAAALYFAFGPKPPPPPHPLPVTPQEVATASQHIDAVQKALTQDAPAPAPTGTSPGQAQGLSARPTGGKAASGPETVTLRVSQADLNTYVTGNARLRSILEAKGVHAVTVALAVPANITFHAAATFRGVSGNALVAAAMTPDPRTAVHLDITEARFGRFPPPVIRAAADAILGQVLKRPQKTLPVTIQSVRVVGADLVITEIRHPPPPDAP